MSVSSSQTSALDVSGRPGGRDDLEPKKAKLVVCCDGTSNSDYLDEEQSPPTNVSRISRAIRPSHADGHRQIVLYLQGIGTDEGNYYGNSWNQGVGVGLDSQILEAYTFLCHNYNKETDDDIILIGFSRGAFAMRCLVDFIMDKGLLTKGSLHHRGRLFSEWKNPLGKSPLETLTVEHDATEAAAGIRPIDLKYKPRVRKVRIQVCALWDTVSSVGIPGTSSFGWRRPKELGFVNSNLREGVDNAFQAVSLFEYRFNFPAIVLRQPKEAALVDCKLEQCWFSGYHGDVGGGNSKEALAHFALAWMISRLDEFLTIDKRAFWYRVDNKPTWALPGKLEVPDSFYSRWFWRLAGVWWRAPRIHFWDENGIYEEDASQFQTNDDFSMENMHATVRYMVHGSHLVPHFNNCPSLQGISPQQSGSSWHWSLVSKAALSWWARVGRRTGINQWFGANVANMTPYNIPEGDFVGRERDILQTWAEQEYNFISQDGDIAAGSLGRSRSVTIQRPVPSCKGDQLEDRFSIHLIQHQSSSNGKTDLLNNDFGISHCIESGGGCEIDAANDKGDAAADDKSQDGDLKA